ncbi:MULTISPECIES: DivIVA domain-containing protein [unclassified Pseudofrankia]|uniref:DivIVA domain-containing protein n=1 Tax=unclassified Pseudofrankia TaxID=2994372 RepID=UPI000A44A88E|nr:MULTISPECIES: DivIVA domain-containing protein [unclassified Pseudofrankia]MDT3441232.1 DivIVA domain-containing protein [Pseudofrankia sp. BMG5.37]
MVLVIEVLVIAAVVFVVAALAVGWFDRMAPAPPDAVPTGLPATGPVSAREVAAARLNLAFRGYRMAEVDALLARLASELAWRDDELARRDEELVRLATFAHADLPASPPASGTAPTDAFSPTSSQPPLA